MLRFPVCLWQRDIAGPIFSLFNKQQFLTILNSDKQLIHQYFKIQK